MGTFNSLMIDRDCPVCGAHLRREVQFRYGHVRQHELQQGDQVPWRLRGDDIGVPGLPRVRVLGWMVACPGCGGDEGNVAVMIESDVITNVKPWHGPLPASEDEWWQRATDDVISRDDEP